MEKKTLGRKKVEMVKMTNESHLQVTFSKRRTGLFKKASEFSIICGSEVVLVVISPGKKVFSFGNPSVDTVIDRFLGCGTRDTSGIEQLIEARRNANIRELCMQITQVTSLLGSEKKRGEALNQMEKANRQQNWWMSPVEELDLPQLLQLKPAMEELKKNVEAEMMLAVLNPSPGQFYVGSSSREQEFDADMMDGGYTVPDMIAPPPGYNLNPTQGYTVNPLEEYNVNPAQGYSVIPSDGYNVNPTEGYTINPEEVYIVDPIEECNANPSGGYNNNSAEGENVNPAGGYDANAQGTGIPGPRGSGGGYNANPQENDVFDPLGFFLDDLEMSFSS
ncbi:hypothetical protein HRI_000729400 [Hibiscus trionum]|uniref:MADS-box domain-containing protein n=1 Tax=Hibiscus trionum TaxID=183268 RepID=A0A9W7H5T5_HIBTR|nr:hypothetical protein HRI_000729400 [Hibiscus trionum]